MSTPLPAAQAGQMGRVLLAQRWVLAGAAIQLLAGHLLPWAAHKTAALTLSAHELAVFTQLTPGAAVFPNEGFYLSVWSCALMLSGSAAASASRLTRLMVAALAAFIASLSLPSYPHVLTAYGNPDLQAQFFVTLAVMAGSAGLTLAGLTPFRSPTAPRGTAWIASLGVIAAVPLVGYLAVRSPIEQLYRDVVQVGLGWWLTLLGAATAWALAAWRMLESARTRDAAASR